VADTSWWLSLITSAKTENNASKYATSCFAVFEIHYSLLILSFGGV
jgi:hypothetical protein